MFGHKVSPESMVPPVGKTTTTKNRENNHFPELGSLMGTPYYDLTPWGLQGNLQCSTTENLIGKEKEGGVCNKQHKDFGKPCSYLQCPGSNSNQWIYSSAEPSRWCTLTRKLSGLQIYLIQILKRGVLLALDPGLPRPRQGA